MNSLFKNEPESGLEDVPVSWHQPSSLILLGSHQTPDQLPTTNSVLNRASSNTVVNKESGSGNEMRREIKVDTDCNDRSDESSDISETIESQASDELEGLSADNDLTGNDLPFKRKRTGLSATKRSSSFEDGIVISSPPKKVRLNGKPNNFKTEPERGKLKTALKESASESLPIVFHRKIKKREGRVRPRINIKIQPNKHPTVRKKCEKP